MSSLVTAETPECPPKSILPSSIKREFLPGHITSSWLGVAMWLNSGQRNGKGKVMWQFLGPFLEVHLGHALDSHLIHLFLLVTKEETAEKCRLHLERVEWWATQVWVSEDLGTNLSNSGLLITRLCLHLKENTVLCGVNPLMSHLYVTFSQVSYSIEMR